MIYTSLQNVLIERPIKPLYAKTQATAQDWTLDPAIITGNTVVIPGVIATAKTNTAGHPVAAIATANDKPIGFFANFVNGLEDEVVIAGNNKCAIWTLNNDARFFINKSVFATGATPAIGDFIGAGADGKPTTVQDVTKAVAKVYDVTSEGMVVEGLAIADTAE